MAKKSKKTTGKKKKIQLRNVHSAVFYVQSSFNNTMITMTTEQGDVLAISSAGQMNFKGTKKSTPFAATLVGKNIVEKAANYNIKEAIIYVSGVGSGRDSAVRTIATSGITINQITDITPVPHNGCRARKPKRV
jgi:small subunit ribosomal protein S11